jgi:hypothetical protein
MRDQAVAGQQDLQPIQNVESGSRSEGAGGFNPLNNGESTWPSGPASICRKFGPAVAQSQQGKICLSSISPQKRIGANFYRC